MKQIFGGKFSWQMNRRFVFLTNVKRYCHGYTILPLPRCVTLNNVPRRSSAELRRLFIDYFQDEALIRHTYLPPSSIIAKKNEGSYFINAGMNQFKSVFLGGPQPEVNGAPVSSAVNSQRCLRIGGKHNDLDDVGWDGHHHTSFEMLGNWSFGSYGKSEACSMMWHFLTDVIRLPKKQLYVSVFAGCRELGLSPDIEANDAWLKLGISDTKMVSFGPSDNLWLMGNKGVGGVCTEVHFDWLGQGGRCARCFVNSDSSEVVELWNAVFINHELLPSGHLRPLGKTFVDTGMGLERLTAIVQGVTSNYDTDLFVPLIEEISSLIKQNNMTTPTYSGVPCVIWPSAISRESSNKPNDRLPCSLPFETVIKGDSPGNSFTPHGPRFTESQLLSDVSHRIVADHLRSIWLACNEGLLPHRQGVGLKLRHLLHRILFNACYGLSLRVDQITDKLIPILHRSMLETTLENIAVWPHLEQRLIKIITKEAEHFLPHLEECLHTFHSATSTLPFGGVINQEIVQGMLISCPHMNFDLVSAFSRRFGFQLDPSIVIGEGGKDVSHSQPHSLTLSEHDIQLANTLKSRGVTSTNTDDRYNYHLRHCPSTKEQQYVFPPTKAQVSAILDGASGKPLRKAHMGQRIMLCLDRTNFYWLSGGQACDLGLVSRYSTEDGVNTTPEVDESQVVMKVEEVTHLPEGDYVLHEGVVTGRWGVKVGDTVLLHIDKSRRLALMQHHTATHMLHWALDVELGLVADNPLQLGSSVKPNELTFQFSCLTPMSPEFLQRVQDVCQQLIDSHRPISTTVMPFTAAQKLGSVYIKEHEYSNVVRVVMIEDIQCSKTSATTSHAHILTSEICGGTHLLNTKDTRCFLFTGCAKQNQTIKEITAVVGSLAETISSNGIALLQETEKINAARKEKDWATAHELLCDVEKKLKTTQIGYLHRRTVETKLVEMRYSILSAIDRLRRHKSNEIRQSIFTTLKNQENQENMLLFVEMELIDEKEIVADISKIELTKPVIFFDGKKGLMIVPKTYGFSTEEIANRISSSMLGESKGFSVRPLKTADPQKIVMTLRCVEGRMCEFKHHFTCLFEVFLRQSGRMNK